jgi:hypothetical protein
MTQTNLHMTVFEIHKLQNIVGLGSASPYQITTYPGAMVGMVGTITDPAKISASNEDNSDAQVTVAGSAAKKSWLNRALTASGLKRG